MNWQETVMSEEQITNCVREAPNKGYSEMLVWRSVIPAQAEISYEAGFAECKRQMIELLEKKNGSAT